MNANLAVDVSLFQSRSVRVYYPVLSSIHTQADILELNIRKSGKTRVHNHSVAPNSTLQPTSMSGSAFLRIDAF